MERIGISACAVQINLPGDHSTSGYKQNASERGNSTVWTRISQESSGNRIGHNPLLPKLFIPPAGHKRPNTIREICYWFNGTYQAPKKYTALSYHFNKDGTLRRQKRSEARERNAGIGAAITHYYDVLTGKLGFIDDSLGKFTNVSYKTIAQKSGFSIFAVQRYMQEMQNLGLIKVTKKYKINHKGDLVSEVSRKEILPAFFIKLLGISAWQKIKQLKEWLLKKIKPKGKHAKENLKTLMSLVTCVIPSQGQQQTLKQKMPLLPQCAFTAHMDRKSTPESLLPLIKSAGKKIVINSKEKLPEKSFRIIDQRLTQKAIDMYNMDNSRTPTEYLKILINTS